MNGTKISAKSDAVSLKRPWLALVLAFLAAGSPCLEGADDLSAKFQALAAKCDELGLKEQAEITRHWLDPRLPGRQYLYLPTDDPTTPKAGAAEVIRQWHGKFREYRRAYGESLFVTAQEIAAREPARAYQRLHEVLRQDPDHAATRRVLGYDKNAPSLAAAQPRVDLPKLGWRAGKYWRLDTPHFSLVTNHSAKEALEAGVQLENLHALWRQIFFRYWSTPEALAARMAGGNEPLAPPQEARMNVVLFKSREEYIAYLTPAQPQIGLTLGIYLDQQRTAYFYAGDTSVYPTWYHEATHQLFQEGVRGTRGKPGESRNFWALEGAALYMESLAIRDGYWTAGGCETDRLQFARYRALSGDFFVPSATLAAMGREQIQASPDIRKLYAQAAGLAHFLIDSAGGKHRETLVDLLIAIYHGEDAVDSLPKATGLSFAELDGAYKQFLNVTDDDLAGIPDPARLKNLSLGRTAVTDAGLACLAGCKNLEWLDLSNTAITDAGMKSLASATSLKQLFLEGTKISDASLPLIVGMKSLEELDLSNLAISDAGLAAIAGLKTLKVLYLSGSPISDAGLVHLGGLKQLESLESTGTKITPEGLKNLRAALPKLKQE